MPINAKIVSEVYEKMAENHTISAYHGDFSFSVVNMLLKHAKSDLTNRNVSKRTLKKTYNILVECLENIHKHTNSIKKNYKGDQIYEGVVLLGHNEPDFYVTVGNMVHNNNIEGLKNKLDDVNNSSNQELRDKHKYILVNGKISSKGGAGLGLLEIAIKSANKIEYNFRNYNDDFSFFSMQVLIPGEIKDKIQN